MRWVIVNWKSELTLILGLHILGVLFLYPTMLLCLCQICPWKSQALTKENAFQLLTLALEQALVLQGNYLWVTWKYRKGPGSLSRIARNWTQSFMHTSHVPVLQLNYTSTPGLWVSNVWNMFWPQQKVSSWVWWKRKDLCSCLSDRVTCQPQRITAAFVFMLDDVPQRAKAHLPLAHETSELHRSWSPGVLFTHMTYLLDVKTDLISLGIMVHGRTQNSQEWRRLDTEMCFSCQVPPWTEFWCQYHPLAAQI